MTYDVGIIGTGGIAERHATAYEETDGIALRTAADVDRAALDAFGDRWGIANDRRYTDHESMLAVENLDAVSICSPSFLHHDHVLDAVDSPAAPDVIFCEKPIATSVADAREMVDACAAAEIELLIDHTRRFHPTVQSLRRFVREDGALGEPISVNVQWAGELLRNGTHVVDLLVFLLGARGAGVNGGRLLEVEEEEDSPFDDTRGASIFTLTDGTMVTFDLTRTRQQPTKVTDFLGTEGRLHVDWWDEEFRYWECTDSLVSDRPEAREDLYGDFRERKVSQFAEFPTDSVTSLRNAMTHVRDLLDGEAENVSPGRDAVAVLELLIGVYLSHHTGGGHVSLPLARPLRGTAVSLP